MGRVRTRGPNRPTGKFVRHDWMWLWKAGSKLREEIVFKSSGGKPGGTPNAALQFQSDDIAVRTMVDSIEDGNLTSAADGEPASYDAEAEVRAAREDLDEEVRDACSVAAENLDEYRRLRGITAAQAGEALGINESTFRTKMRSVENMRLGEFLALCATLEVDPAVALGFVDGEDAASVRTMHRLGAVEDHRYIGEMAEFLTGKSGSYFPRHAVVPHAVADAEHTLSGDKTNEDDRWPRWYETDESYEDYGPYFHAELRDDDDEEDSPGASEFTGYFMDAEGNIYDPEQEKRDEDFTDAVIEYFRSRGIEAYRLDRSGQVIGREQPGDGDDVEDSSE